MGIIYNLYGGKNSDSIQVPVTAHNGLPVINYQNVDYILLGGVRRGVNFVLATEQDEFDGYTYKTVLSIPGNPHVTFDLVENARQNVDVGDNLVGVVLKGNVPENHIRQGNVVLLPPQVLEILANE
ncbi:MAG TPA: hypothetical protein VJI68_02115 [Candidatus Nanoarchaeia archaeon]|nr:hypothetical protein [Candidatus Nanoarchaeia archaeon]